MTHIFTLSVLKLHTSCRKLTSSMLGSDFTVVIMLDEYNKWNKEYFDPNG